MSEHVDQLLEVANAISRGEVPEYQQNECFTAGAFDLVVITTSASEAFKLLVLVCQRYEAVSASASSMRGYFYLLEQLVRKANTTELPSGMQSIIANHPELSHELRAWYRLQS